jgi:hypothetical protein
LPQQAGELTTKNAIAKINLIYPQTPNPKFPAMVSVLPISQKDRKATALGRFSQIFGTK